MLFYTFYYNALLMGGLTIFFHHILNKYNIETRMFEKYSINLMRSLICGTIAHESYNNYKYLWLDKCLDNIVIYNKFEHYHYMFLSYFIFDTIILLYQIYLKIEKNIRIDLFLHHILAITSLIIIEQKKMFGISVLIGLSEGMSLVSGPKLLSMYLNYKNLTNIFITFRLIYLILVRMIFLWPTLIYYYHKSTLECINYKNERNMFLVIFLISLIFHAEINWLHSGRKELARI
jgi:hypothetical protein